MPRLTYKHQGYHNATDEEAVTMLQEGWTAITDEEFQKVLAKKGKKEEDEFFPAPEPTVPVTKIAARHGNRTNTNR